ncbi:MAG: hypothetical protein ACE15C_18980 [Phycisphaerae bacterium]
MQISVVWSQSPGSGTVEVRNGRLSGLRIVGGPGRASRSAFDIPAGSPARLVIAIDREMVSRGAHATLVTVRGRAAEFSFFPRDVLAGRPIWIPDYGVAVTTAGDKRKYAQIAEAIRAEGLIGDAQRFDSEPEESYEAACARNRDLMCPTWLGLSRDMRIFRVGYEPERGCWGFVQPCYHFPAQAVPESDNKPISIGFCIGPGESCRVRIDRWLDEKVLPILHSRQVEDDVTYDLTAFATLETRPISLKNLRGSDWRAVYPNCCGHMLKADEVAAMKPLLDAEMHGREEETVCCIRVEAVNTGRTPRYAWFKALHGLNAPTPAYDGKRGFSKMGRDTQKVFGVNLLDGRPMPQAEMAILLPPGGKAVVDMLVPHQPLPEARVAKLAKMNVAEHLASCRAFWKAKLAAGSRIHVPEPAVDERVRAGLLHLDIVAYGREPRGSVLATIGWYAPIGSESSPIIQFFDSMGWHGLAERSLNFFLDRQRSDGFIQNFGGYQLETGPALWSMGEHYRYTRDDGWVRRIKPKLLKACEYLLAWRNRNKREELRGRGYGLQDGKVADPDDFFHSFMLNGLSYVGIQRVAEMLEKMDPAESRRLAKEARAYRDDIRTAFYKSMARSPVIPLGDGTWVPSAPPWAEYHGPVSLYADGGDWHTHGMFGGRDSLIGALYLVISEVLDPREIGTTFLLKSHQALFTVQNAGMSQPYYCRHDFAHIRRGEVRQFLKTYYNQFTALQDRQTYTFWEHYHFASQHKTHEEGWFLMQTRWMLWLEEGGELAFLRGIPRRWLEGGKEIRLENVATYFGPASLHVRSDPSGGTITAEVSCRGGRRPKTVTIRLPHPDGRLPVRVEGGRFDGGRETIRIANFRGQARVTLTY